jgi:hypothetical protein
MASRHRGFSGLAAKGLAAISGLALATAVLLGGAGAGSAAPGKGFTHLVTLGLNEFPTVQAVRSSDGTLHLVWSTSAPKGVGTRTISADGTVGKPVQAFKSFGVAVPGILQLGSGQLEIVFGGTQKNNYSSLFGVSSSDGGATWSSPEVDVAGSPGTNDEGTLWVAHVLALRSGSAPVLVLSIGGSITVQEGLGKGSKYNASIVNSSDNFAGGVNVALDAASKEVVASWTTGSNQQKTPTVFVQRIWPKLGTLEKMPGQFRNEFVLSGRDSGAGVYGGYTTDGAKVSLLRYGGGSVTVDSVKGVTANIIGTATGLDGRIWIFWGDTNGGLAVTRSNKAVTAFEPIQQVDPHAGSLYRLWGDGRLGPLDLFVDMVPAGTVKGGTYYRRILPELSAVTSVKAVTKNNSTVHELTVHVSDAGDHLAGVTVSAAGQTAKTGAGGAVTLTLPASVGGVVTVNVALAGYQPLSVEVNV